jgi:hypothetical protein
VTETAHSRSQVAVPAHVGAAFQVYVNGVLQQPGRDYRVRGRTLLFERELRQEGRLGFWRWTSILFGVAGTYRQNDVIDLVYEQDGRRAVESGLAVEPAP